MPSLELQITETGPLVPPTCLTVEPDTWKIPFQLPIQVLPVASAITAKAGPSSSFFRIGSHEEDPIDFDRTPAGVAIHVVPLLSMAILRTSFSSALAETGNGS